MGPARLLLSLLTLGGVLMTQGCSPVARGSADGLRHALLGPARPAIDADALRRSPYDQLLASTGQGEAVLVLGKVDDRGQHWYSANQEMLLLKDGLLVGSVGLKQDLRGLRFTTANPFATGLQHVQAPTAADRIIDLWPAYRYGVPVHAVLTPGPLESVRILDEPRTLRRIDERIEAPALGWHATNHYWLDPRDGRVWKSRQAIAPGLSIDTVMLQPHGTEARP